MANDNKKINDLVSESDDDTSELKALSEDTLRGTDFEFEADAATQAFETLGKDGDADNDSIAALRSELRDRDENIEHLEFDLQQLRSRSKGLETELEARKELTGRLVGDLEQQKYVVRDLSDQLKQGQERLSNFESQLQERDDRLNVTAGELDEVRKQAQTATTAYEDLERRHTASARDVNALRTELTEEQARRKWAEDAERTLGEQVAQLDEQYTEAQGLVASLQDYVEARKSRWDTQESELKSRERDLKAQNKNIKELAKNFRRTTTLLDKEKSTRTKVEARLETSRNESERLRTEISALNDAIVEKDKTLQSLQADVDMVRQKFDHASGALQQLEDRHSGAVTALDEERSRAAALQEELTRVRAAAADTERMLGEKAQSLDEASLALQRLEDEHNGTVAALQQERNRVASLQDEVERTTAGVAELEQALGEKTQSAEDLRNRNAQSEAALEEQRNKRESLAVQLDEAQATRQRLSDERDSLAMEIDALRAEVRELREISSAAAEREQSNSHLAGLVSSQESVIDELREQIGKTEGYADTLREKLQRQMSDAETVSANNRRLQDNLDGASRRLDELSADLNVQRQRNTELSAQVDEAQRQFDEELGKVRLDLDEARTTIAGNRDINEQLTAELAESTSRREALEARLNESDSVQKTQVRDLSSHVAKLKRKLENYEQKLANKEAAVKALLSEFASKPKGGDLAAAHTSVERDGEDSVRRLPVRRGALHDDNSGTDRDRVTRLLVGTIEGQKLRFPLFKDKLTIGRTAHNDIQIKAQFISRRHAVVVTEGERTRIVDWGSKNGVYVNGIRITEQDLRNGDVVTVGTAEFVFEERPKR